MSVPSRLMSPEQLLIRIFQHGLIGHRRLRKRTSLALSAVCILAAYLAMARECLASTPEPVRLQRGEIVLAVEQRPNGDRFLKAKILLYAPLPEVWEAVRKERDPDLAWSRVALQVSSRELLAEEQFKPLPLVGPVRCVRRITETPYKRIDYQLVTSDHFRALEGSWILTASEDGRYVVVELSSHVKLDRWAPRFAIEHVGLRKLEQRLNRIRESIRKKTP